MHWTEEIQLEVEEPGPGDEDIIIKDIYMLLDTNYDDNLSPEERTIISNHLKEQMTD